MTDISTRIQERKVEPLLVAGIRMTGNYSDCGQGFATLGKRSAATSPASRCACSTTANTAKATPTSNPACRSAKPSTSTASPSASCRPPLRHAHPPRPVRRTKPLVRPADEIRERTRLRSFAADARSLPKRPRHDLPRQPEEVRHRNPTDSPVENTSDDAISKSKRNPLAKKSCRQQGLPQGREDRLPRKSKARGARHVRDSRAARSRRR